MLDRSKARVVLAAAVLIFVPVTVLTQTAADPAVQAVADRVSQTQYQKYQLDVENIVPPNNLVCIEP